MSENYKHKVDKRAQAIRSENAWSVLGQAIGNEKTGNWQEDCMVGAWYGAIELFSSYPNTGGGVAL